MTTAIECEWCSDVTKFRLFCRDNEYERYACDQHIVKTRRQARLDGYDKNDIEECHSLAGPYLYSDLIYKGPGTSQHARQHKCAHGVQYEHPTEYCAICLREAMRGEGGWVTPYRLITGDALTELAE